MVRNLLLLGVFLVGFVSSKPTNHQKVFKTPLGIPYQGEPIHVDKNILSTSHIDFVSHPGGNNSWLGMTLDYEYVKPIFEIVNTTETPLINRGEAHITVISPPEFSVLATVGITLEQVDKIANDLKIQSSKFSIVCLGKEDVIVNNVDMIVYQILVKSKNLLKIRQKLFQLYAEKGGNTALYDPNAFWPHITVGFTVSDLFIQNGVYKGANVCYRPIRLK